jgi:hypothetical protein
MNTLSCLTVALVAYTASIFPSAQETVSSELEEFGTFDVVRRTTKIPTKSIKWTANPNLKQTVAYQIGSDGYGIQAYHTVTNIWDTFAGRAGETDSFGFVITQNPAAVVTAGIFKQFLKPTVASFEIKENHFLTINGSPLTPVIPYARANPLRKFIFLCADVKKNNEIDYLLKEQVPTLCTLTAAASFLRVRIPTTTFVLFDIIDYCKTVLGTDSHLSDDSDDDVIVRKRSHSR